MPMSDGFSQECVIPAGLGLHEFDHRPPRVHIIGTEEHARFELQCDLGGIRLLSHIGFQPAQLKQIEAYFTTSAKLAT